MTSTTRRVLIRARNRLTGPAMVGLGIACILASWLIGSPL